MILIASLAVTAGSELDHSRLRSVFSPCIFLPDWAAFCFEPPHGPRVSGVTTDFLALQSVSLFAGSFVLTFLQMATMDIRSLKQTKQYFYKYCPDHLGTFN